MTRPRCARSPSRSASPRPRSIITSPPRRTSWSRCTCACTNWPGRAVLGQQLTAEAGPSGWAAELRELVDHDAGQPCKLFILHQRNQTALSGLHIKGHDGDHQDLEQQFRQILGNPAIPARHRVRLSCALGALLSTLMSAGELEDLGPAIYGELFREAISDLLRATGDPSDQHTSTVKPPVDGSGFGPRHRRRHYRGGHRRQRSSRMVTRTLMTGAYDSRPMLLKYSWRCAGVPAHRLQRRQASRGS